MKPLTRAQLESRKDKAVRFTCDVRAIQTGPMKPNPKAFEHRAERRRVQAHQLIKQEKCNHGNLRSPSSGRSKECITARESQGLKMTLFAARAGLFQNLEVLERGPSFLV
jgi:hypothetical protein